MIFCIIAYCGGTDLRDINCLSLICDVGMDSYFLILGIQSFKYNSGCSFKSSCIKGKYYFYASVSVLCCKCGRSCYFFSVYGNCLFGSLIHQNTLNSVLSSNLKTLIGNSINDGCFLCCLGMVDLCCLINCRCTNLWNINGLIFILDLGMNCDLDSLIGQSFKCNYCSSLDCRCIKCKDYINTSFRLFSRKGRLSGYFLTIYQNRLICCLIHECSCYGILTTRKQMSIKYGINNLCLWLCLGMVNLCCLILCSCMNLWDIYCLLCILKVSMCCQKRSVRIQIFKYNSCSSCKL